jgi:hypothetical protein
LGVTSQTPVRELKRRLQTVRTQLQYGKGDLTVEIPSSDVTVLRTKHEEGLPNEAAAFRDAVGHPIGSAPLKELVLERRTGSPL